jgi:hypothetical protein
MRHLTYANVTATLALILSMGSGALAANHYLITSTKQIKPSVLRTLHGARGPQGSAGAFVAGPQGPAGPQGLRGGEANLAKLCSAILYSSSFVVGDKNNTWNALMSIWNQGCH